jgi:hypothetical protein
MEAGRDWAPVVKVRKDREVVDPAAADLAVDAVAREDSAGAGREAAVCKRSRQEGGSARARPPWL